MHPPGDVLDRERRHQHLSEGILAKFVLAVYQVEVLGNTEARKLREKASLIVHTIITLQKIDNISGSIKTARLRI